MTAELLEFCIRGGTVTLLTSTIWQEKDYNALKHQEIEQEVEDPSIEDPNYWMNQLEILLEQKDNVKPTKMLVALVKSGRLKIKIGILRENYYHEKTGFFEDDEKNVILFYGTGNESRSAFRGQGNSFTIYCNFKEDIESAGAWKGHGIHNMKNLVRDIEGKGKFIVKDFPDVDELFIEKHKIEPNLESYRASAVERSEKLSELYDEHFGDSSQDEEKEQEGNQKKDPVDGDDPQHVTEVAGLDTEVRVSPTEMIEDRPHQVEALKKWKNAGYKGILKHATGSGKTITALAAIEQHLANNDPVILIVPGIPLLDQWEEEIEEKLGAIDLAIFGGGKQHKEDYALFKMLIQNGLKQSTLIMCTKDTFSGNTISQYILNTKSKYLKNILFVVDECHKAGEPLWRPLMNLEFGKALGLSATPERSYGLSDDDEEEDGSGNDIIASLLGEVIDEFSLLDAINAKPKGYLTGFVYHLSDIELTAKEQKKFEEERKKIGQWGGDPSQNVAIHNARRIVRGATGKIPEAVRIITEDYELGQYWLIYCATTKMLDEVRDSIMEGNPHLKRFMHEYHSGNKDQREQVLDIYRREGGIMLAMKCLDEGINIPNITHGIVLSSSTMEREFIQRRGRMLRKKPGKEEAHIYDVVCLPGPGASESSEENILKNEIARVEEFGGISKNALKVKFYLMNLKSNYNK